MTLIWNNKYLTNKNVHHEQVTDVNLHKKPRQLSTNDAFLE